MSVIKRAGVVGWPVEHSLSPVIYQFWFQKLDIAGSYEKIPLHPSDAEAFFKNFSAQRLTGCNVTIPHKQTAAKACDHLDEIARKLGVANTLWLNEQGELCGANSDMAGFLDHLADCCPGLDADWRQRPATGVILGAGGAARAVAHGLLHYGASKIIIVNRNRNRAEALAGEFDVPIEVANYDDRHKVLSQADILVNATSLGMAGQEELELPLAGLRPSAIIYDIVYTPLRTRLLREAQERGLLAIDGLGMLLHQARLGFGKWFGVVPEVTDGLRDYVIAKGGLR